MNNKEIQRLLQEIVVDGLELQVKQIAEKYEDIKGWDPLHPWFLSTLFTYTLPGHENLKNNFDPSSDAVKVVVNYPLLVQLLTELMTNASRVTRRRHPQDSSKIADHKYFFATTRVKRDPDGGARIEIEDFGFPNEYIQIQGVGNSHSAQNGVGIGRFRSYLLAGFMGYKIWHRAKPDGSGSIMTLLIPKSHVVEKNKDAGQVSQSKL